MTIYHRNFAILAWLVFFLSPLAWPKTIDSYFAMDLLALAIGLIAASHFKDSKETDCKWPWLFLLALIVPIFLQLLFMDVRNPWKSWQMALYLISAWLIFRYSQSFSTKLITSLHWFVLLACVGNVYVIFALLQDYNLHIISGNNIFPIWQEMPTRFGGVLIQTNLQALFLVIVCITLWIRGLAGKAYIPWLIASILPCAGLFATSSRSGVITLCVGVVALILLSKTYRSSTFKLVSCLGLAALLASYWQTTGTLSDSDVITRFQAGGFETRLFIWDMAIRLFFEHPWLGIGAGNLISYGTEAHLATLAQHPDWADSANSLSGGHMWAHNYILQFFLEFGAMGGVAVLILTLMTAAKFMRLWLNKIKLDNAQVHASVILLLLLFHGMGSVALLQGFFLVLFALYASALFPAKEQGLCPPRHITSGHLIGKAALFVMPVFLLLYIWMDFISTELDAERAVGLPANSTEFIVPIAKGIDTPWTSRSSLEMYFANLVFQHAKPVIWINSEGFAYRYWLQHQSSLSLRYRILIAHLKNDAYAESRMVNLYQKAYPNDSATNYLIRHVEQGHSDGEAIDIWK